MHFNFIFSGDLKARSSTGGFSKQQPASLPGCFEMIYARVHTETVEECLE